MKKLISVLIAILIFLFSAFTVTAVEYDVTYEEDFEYGETDIKAVGTNGYAEIVEEDGNHILRLKPNNIGYSLFAFGPYVADYDFTVRVRQNSHGGQNRFSKILLHSEWGEGETYQLNLYV